MFEIIDKVLIYLCCTGIFLSESAHGLWIIPVILVLTLGSLNSYVEQPFFHVISFVFYCVLCIFWSNLLTFLPLILYDVISHKKSFVYLLSLVPIISNYGYISDRVLLITISFMAFTMLLRFRTLKTEKLRQDYVHFKDKATEVSILLKNQNASLIANQDHEINVATLSERNRIAREIHDNLGHILSRSLLQIGAVIAINKDPNIKEMLNGAKDTLSFAMDSVRKSVHNLHDESIDLHDQVYGLIKDFTFCPIKLNYDISENIDKKLKYCFISIVKESLSNIIKHSNASEVSIYFKEHPGSYQLIIQDNGVVQGYNPEKGIGLKNMADRVETFNGNVNINTDNGFKIFISIPRDVYNN